MSYSLYHKNVSIDELKTVTRKSASERGVI
jgi:hypothetical protein